MQSFSRRQFLTQATATTAAFAALSAWPRSLTGADPAPTASSLTGFGPLVADPAGIMDLPKGFSYRVISKAGEPMQDGLPTPGLFDGMASFPGATPGVTILVRNHEISSMNANMGPFPGGLPASIPVNKTYDKGTSIVSPGGTTTLHYDHQTGNVTKSFLSLAGTERNCAGGPTPWGSWLTCEESVCKAGEEGRMQDHGYVFEVRADANGLVDPIPLRDMGRFYHEAAAVDPIDGAVLLTEDKINGLLYRFVPKTPGKLMDGGSLFALGLTTPNKNAWNEGESRAIRWIPMTDVTSPKDNLRKIGAAAGAMTFPRGEGLFVGKDGIYMACTLGGPADEGQIWRIGLGGKELTLFANADGTILENGDNLVVAPFGHLIICEDLVTPFKNKSAMLVGMAPDRSVYKIARNALNKSELAGVCFSADHKVLFVNIQEPGLTVAITGPWPT